LNAPDQKSGRGSVFLWWRRCDTLSTSGFANDVMFALCGQQQATRKGGSDVWRGLFELVLIQQGHLTWCVHAGVRSTVGFSGAV